MGLNAFEALCAKAGKLKRAIGVFSWQVTLQHDALTSCSKKQDLSQAQWKNKRCKRHYWSHCFSSSEACADHWTNLSCPAQAVKDYRAVPAEMQFLKAAAPFWAKSMRKSPNITRVWCGVTPWNISSKIFEVWTCLTMSVWCYEMLWDVFNEFWVVWSLVNGLSILPGTMMKLNPLRWYWLLVLWWWESQCCSCVQYVL